MPKLTRKERVRLSRAALQITGSEERAVAAEAYRSSPVLDHEYVDSEDPLSWDAEGWEAAERAFAPGLR